MVPSIAAAVSKCFISGTCLCVSSPLTIWELVSGLRPRFLPRNRNHARKRRLRLCTLRVRATSTG